MGDRTMAAITLVSAEVTTIGVLLGAIAFWRAREESRRQHVAFVAILQTLNTRGWIDIQRDPETHGLFDRKGVLSVYNIPQFEGRPGVITVKAKPGWSRARIVRLALRSLGIAAALTALVLADLWVIR